MTKLQFTVEYGWDAHISAGYDPKVYQSPEEAVEAQGVRFHPDFDSVVRREVGTVEWRYSSEDQKYDRAEKIQQYREAHNGEG